MLWFLFDSVFWFVSFILDLHNRVAGFGSWKWLKMRKRRRDISKDRKKGRERKTNKFPMRNYQII